MPAQPPVNTILALHLLAGRGHAFAQIGPSNIRPTRRPSAGTPLMQGQADSRQRRQQPPMEAPLKRSTPTCADQTQEALTGAIADQTTDQPETQQRGSAGQRLEPTTALHPRPAKLTPLNPHRQQPTRLRATRQEQWQ